MIKYDFIVWSLRLPLSHFLSDMMHNGPAIMSYGINLPLNGLVT